LQLGLKVGKEALGRIKTVIEPPVNDQAGRRPAQLIVRLSIGWRLRFKVVELKMFTSARPARRVLQGSRGKPFLAELVEFMSSRDRGDGAERETPWLPWRTDRRHRSKKAAVGTLRQNFAIDVGKNSVHASDSVENAAVEIKFHFGS